MSKTRNLSDLLDANGDVKSTALDNVPASNDASALTTGTLPNARLSAVPNSALANSSITINGSATSLGGSATINTDLSNDTTPQLGGTLDTNGNPINFGDNDKAQFGASQDLQVFHDGSNSYVRDVGTGNLKLQGANINIENADGTKDHINCDDNGAVNLFHNGSKKFETSSGGATVTGTLTANAFSGDGSALTGVGGLTEVDMWRLNANHTGSTIFTNWERIDNLNGTYVGTGMSVSSGVFTFPSTGKYYIDLKGHTENPNANNTDVDVRLQVSTDGGSNFNTTSSAWSQGRGSGYSYHFGTFTLVDVTSTSNVKVRVRSNSPRSDQSYYGSTNRTDTGIMFMKVGST